MVSSDKKYFYNIEKEYVFIKYLLGTAFLFIAYYKGAKWFQVRLCTVLGWKLLSIFDFARVLFVAQRRTMIAGGVKNMYNQQTIMCDVCACRHHDKQQHCCKLSQITVTPCADCETAHYCKNYEEK